MGQQEVDPKELAKQEAARKKAAELIALQDRLRAKVEEENARRKRQPKE